MAETGTASARAAMIKRFAVCALAILIAGGTLVGTIALKAAVYLSRVSY